MTKTTRPTDLLTSLLLAKEAVDAAFFASWHRSAPTKKYLKAQQRLEDLQEAARSLLPTLPRRSGSWSRQALM